MFILTHGFIKKSQKADPKQKAKAIKIREGYHAVYRTVNSNSSNCKDDEFVKSQISDGFVKSSQARRANPEE
jgi:hypothetical protein